MNRTIILALSFIALFIASLSRASADSGAPFGEYETRPAVFCDATGDRGCWVEEIPIDATDTDECLPNFRGEQFACYAANGDTADRFFRWECDRDDPSQCWEVLSIEYWTCTAYLIPHTCFPGVIDGLPDSWLDPRAAGIQLQPDAGYVYIPIESFPPESREIRYAHADDILVTTSDGTFIRVLN